MGTKHLRRTAYHPQANGMVEIFQRQLKSSLKCHETENWTEILPIVLLGIRTVIKEDINASSSANLPTLATHRGSRKSFIFKELFTTPSVFVRRDSVNGPLQPSYDGPFTVKRRNIKYFTIIINNKDTSISFDILYPAFVLLEENNKGSTTIRTSPSDSRNPEDSFQLRTGRKIRFRERLKAGFL
jgi:hypothetical protein